MASNPKPVDTSKATTTTPTPVVAPASAPTPTTATDPKADAKDLAGEIETGGLSPFRRPDHVIAGVVEKVEDAIKTEINALKKNDPPLGKDDKLVIIGYRLNVVNGYLYFAKVTKLIAKI